MPEAKRVENRVDDDVSIDFGAMQKVFNPAPPSKREPPVVVLESPRESWGFFSFFSL